MKSTIKSFCVVVAASIALVASVFTAFATPAAAGFTAAGRPGPILGQPAAQSGGCTDMKPTAIAWVTLTADHHIDKQVSSYPSGTHDITPIFQYDCAPDSTTIVSVFSLNGQTIFSDQEQIPAASLASLYGYALEPLDGSALSDGQWGVQYFKDKTMLTSGSVTIGGANANPSQTGDATVQGIVQDQNSQSPIGGAVILLLNPGVQLQDFIKNGAPDSDVFAGGKSDSQGSFTFSKKLQRHQVYDMFVKADGYQDLGSTTFQINDEPAPVSITVSMTK